MRALAAGALLLAACGPPPAPGTGGFDFELVVQRGLLDQISAFQVALVASGSSLDCVAVQKSCLKRQVDASRIVQVAVFPINLTAGTPNTQDASLREVPPGQDYAVVVEALSKDLIPRLTGSSCTYLKEVTPGTNATVVAKIELLSPPASCDPRLE